MKINIMTVIKMTLSITIKIPTLSMTSVAFFIVIHSAVMLSAVMLSAVMLSAVMLSAVMLNAVMDSVIDLKHKASMKNDLGTNTLAYFRPSSGLLHWTLLNIF
jgi:hypothetical protein